MAFRRRIADLSRPGYFVNRQTAQLLISDCSAVWVEEGASLRRLELNEVYEARQAKAERRERMAGPLPYAEVPGLRFAPSMSGIPAKRREGSLLWAAHQFVTAAAMA